MRVFTARNTNHMMPIVYTALAEHGVIAQSRNGEVLKFDTPITLVYQEPWDRVNLCPVRDCNHFFHLMEGLAMLRPYNDVEFLSRFNSNIANYSDNGVDFNAFYGTRLRETWGDQLGSVIQLLKTDPQSRQIVAQIWDWRDLTVKSKDKACNMVLVFNKRPNGLLDMTCYNRSNDLIWGSVSGANVVHFSMIHEYVARMAGIDQGVYYQVVNDAHVYLDNPLWRSLDEKYEKERMWIGQDYDEFFTIPLVTRPDSFDEELRQFFETVADSHCLVEPTAFTEPFLCDVAVPVYNAWMERKFYRHETMCDNWLKLIRADDWRMACTDWVARRK